MKLISNFSRDDKRFTEKKNKSERARRKKDDNTRLRELVDGVLAVDPRIKRIRAEEKAARGAKKNKGKAPVKVDPKAAKEAEEKKKAEEAKAAEEAKKNSVEDKVRLFLCLFLFALFRSSSLSLSLFIFPSGHSRSGQEGQGGGPKELEEVQKGDPDLDHHRQLLPTHRHRPVRLCDRGVLERARPAVRLVGARGGQDRQGGR